MRIRNKPTESADLSVEPIQNIQKEEIIRQKLRITKLIQPGVKQKIIRAARMFERRVTSLERDEDFCHLAIDVYMWGVALCGADFGEASFSDKYWSHLYATLTKNW